MDASINITMEPFRAFVGDNLGEEQRSTGYAMQSFFIGLGAVLASALPWILTNGFDVANTARRPDPRLGAHRLLHRRRGPAAGGDVDGVHDQGI
jgi:hypothetical protein